jgi:competence protein ComFC
MDINPQKLIGNWREGYALHFHTLSSIPIKDEDGEIIGWDTKRPPLAEELYRLKYWHEEERAMNIAEVAAKFLSNNAKSWGLHAIIPIPPSDLSREFQPVYTLADQIGALLGIAVNYDVLEKTKSTSELKSIDNPTERQEILQDAFRATFAGLQNKNILLFDDLFRSGETLKAATNVLTSQAKAQNVYVLTITKTRSKK